MVSLGTVMAPVDVSFSLLICYNDHITEAKGLVEVNSPAILDLVGSKQFMLSPSAVILLRAVPCRLPVPAAQGLISTRGLW